MTKRSANGRIAALAALLVAALVWTALPATAEVYTIKLKSGNTFLTRYQPREAAFDSTMVTFLGEHGNLTAVPRDDIEAVTTQVESKGYGLRINTTTVLLGYTANNGEIQGDQVFVSGDSLRLEPVDSGWPGVLARVRLILFEAIAAGHWQRLKICHNAECGRIFYDNARNRRGKWCNVRRCGAPINSRAYRRRGRSGRLTDNLIRG